MLNQPIDAVTDHSWIPSSAWRRLGLPDQKKFARKKVDLLDDVPVMSATVLGLEILLHEPCIDLRMASELVLSDVGATIQILRLVGREYEFATEHPHRMGDCIASLDAGTWFDAISARTFACDRQHAATSSLWNHCRVVAQYSQLVAESLEGISPEEAYLVGLLHEISAIPSVLGWPSESAPLSAVQGSLPLFVLSAIHSMNDSSSSSTWKFILTSAHELAGVETDFDPSTMHGFDSLDVNSRWGALVPAASDCMLAGS
jgi:HDOD domain-containing protein